MWILKAELQWIAEAIFCSSLFYWKHQFHKTTQLSCRLNIFKDVLFGHILPQTNRHATHNKCNVWKYWPDKGQGK